MKNILLLATFILLWGTAWSKVTTAPGSELFNGFEMISYLSNDEPSNNVEIFPNPVTEGRMTVTAPTNILEIRILNITGKMVFDQKYQGDNTSVEIELSNLEKGVYLVQVSLKGHEPDTQKIMIK